VLSTPSKRGPRPVPVLLVSPDRRLAGLFTEAAAAAGCFEVLAELGKYGPASMIEIRMRQLRPAAVVVDLATDAEAACEVIRLAGRQDPPVVALGLDYSSRPEVVMDALRAGACEFVTPPFGAENQRQAAEAARRLAVWDEMAQPEAGRIVGFANAKPGCGASALACHVAYELARQTRQKVLLADLDLAGGGAGFYTGVEHNYSILDLLERSGESGPAAAGSLAAPKHGIDVLPAGPVPRSCSMDVVQMRQLFERLRSSYEWTVLDLPVIFERISLLALAEADCTYVVTGPDLGSLHAARKAVRLLGLAGVGPERFEILLNRAGKPDGARLGEIGKVLGRKVQAVLPEDHGALHAAAATAGQLDPSSPLGGALERWVASLTGASAPERRGGGLLLAQGAAFAGI